MQFQSERQAINTLSNIIVKTGVNLYNSIKYVYSLAEDDFYNCDFNDVLKVIENNINNVDCLKHLGLKINPQKCAEMNSDEYNQVLSLILYSFAVRIPLIKKYTINDVSMTDNQLKEIYITVLKKGAYNYKQAITEQYDFINKLIKKGQPVAEYNANWYKSFILSNVPELAITTNKNIFLLGSVDILFDIFYKNLKNQIQKAIDSLDKI